SDFYANDENTVENDSYTATEVRLVYEATIGRWLLSPFFGIDNLFDEEYNSNVRINANGGRYFEPAPGRNIYGGIGLAYSW
ncbi:MAG TPA: TonB-dependent receptor, partial [Thermodesulfobacteriota bacterium]|nr:TonB-dependent receptor [Thermodesulfobacteriota bacterium]